MVDDIKKSIIEVMFDSVDPEWLAESFPWIGKALYDDESVTAEEITNFAEEMKQFMLIKILQ